MSNTTQALSRIEAILDDSSFVEIGAGVTARSTDFNIQEKKAPSDGVFRCQVLFPVGGAVQDRGGFFFNLGELTDNVVHVICSFQRRIFPHSGMGQDPEN